MSRVGKQPIVLPNGVEATIDGQTVKVKGPKGELSQTLNGKVTLALEDHDGQKAVLVTIPDDADRDARAQWGTARSLIANMVDGVADGFSKVLEVNGVGYRVAVQGKKVVLNVGFSHPVEIELPEGVEGSVEENRLTLTSIDKQKVGAIAAEIRAIRKPEPYKGKGIKYIDEVIRRKAGKAQKAGE